MSPKTIRIQSAALLALLALASCRSLPDPKGREVQVLYAGTLEAVAPADVVVAPVENRSETSDVPTRELREAFYRGLVKRRYSPIALARVDEVTLTAEAGPEGDETGEVGVTEAAYAPGTLEEDAVLQLIVKRWDTRLYDTQGIVDVEIEAWMLDGRRPTGPELWGGRLEKRVSAGGRSLEAGELSARESIARQIAEELLGALPPRPVAPGPRR